MMQHIPNQSEVFMDETGHKEKNQKMWTWIAATLAVCVFFIRKGRNMGIAQEILGKKFSGILTSDRYSAYNWVGARQLCWSHLRRDFKKISERSGDSGRIGDAILLHSRRMFMYGHRFKQKKLTRKKLQKGTWSTQIEILRLLKKGISCGHRKTERTCQRILEYQEFLFTFIHKKKIEPTNNHSERLLRRFVIWRKTSFGTQSESGSRFMERVMSVSATCQLQKRNILGFISTAVRTYINRDQHPSLIPIETPVAFAV